MYVLSAKLRPDYARKDYVVAVVGCGGTGGFVAEGLCRVLAKDIVILLVDHDRVEEPNLIRQNFYKSELGQYKCEALSNRLGDKFKRRVPYITAQVSRIAPDQVPDIIIGCVDNGLARRDIADLMKGKQYGQGNYRGWWIDAGNGSNFGQVLIGNCTISNMRNAFETDHEICYGLPLPTEQRPELLLETPPEPACAENVAAGNQSPVINQLIASLVLQFVYRMAMGTLPWMQLNIDMDTGILSPVLATPENVSGMTGLNIKHLTFSEKKGPNK